MEELRKDIKVAIGSPIVALFLTLLSQAMGLYGLIDMGLARMFMGFAWLVAVVGVCVSDYLRDESWKHILAVALLVGVIFGGVLFCLDHFAVVKKAHDDARTTPPPVNASAPGPSVPIQKVKMVLTPLIINQGNGAGAKVNQHSSGNNSPNSATFGPNSPIIINPTPKQPTEEELKEQRLKTERDDVWNKLKASPTVGPYDDLRNTRFSVINDGNSDIANHVLFCHINSINFTNSIYIRTSHFIPRRFDRGQLRRSGDGESVECMKTVNLGPADCADVTIVVDYTLVDQPLVAQEKTFRFATVKTQTGHAWDIQPLTARIDYCDPSVEP